MYRYRNGFSTYVENAASGELIRERYYAGMCFANYIRGTFKISADISICVIETSETNRLP